MRRRPLLSVLLAPLLAAAGCGRSAGVIFPPPDKPLVWPVPPETPRIRYVGSLSGSADLKPAVSGGQAFGEMLFGKHPEYTLLTPYGVCTDGADRVFVADSNAQFVHVFNLNTRQYQQWKLPEPRRFSQPVGVSFDPDTRHLYVSDSVAAEIYTFDSDGKLLAQTPPRLLNRPTGLAYDRHSRRLLVCDTAAHCIYALAPSGEPITRVGQRGTGPGEFNFPTNVTVDSTGRVYVCDSLNFRVQQFSPDLKFLRAIGKKGDLPGYFSTPKGIAVDSEDHLYVVDANFESIQIFSPTGQLLLDFGEEGRRPGQFWLPAGIFIDPANRIWVADSYNRRLQVFDYLPEVKP